MSVDVQSPSYEQIDARAATSPADSSTADDSGQGHSRSDRRDLHLDLDSGSHERLTSRVPQLQSLVTSLQLELRESQATQMRTRYISDTAAVLYSVTHVSL